MTFQNNFDTINFNFKESFDFFSNNFLMFAPLAPLKSGKKKPIRVSDNNVIDIGREMVALHFYWLCVTVVHLLQNKAGQISLISVDFIEISPFLIRFGPMRSPHLTLNCFYSLATTL